MSMRALPLGVTTWAFPGGLLGRLRIERAAALIRELGYDGLDISVTPVGDVSLRAADTALAALRRVIVDEMRCRILSISTLLLHDHALVSSNQEQSSQALHIASRMITIGAALGADQVVIYPGPSGQVTEQDYERLREHIGFLASLAHDRGLRLLIENIPGMPLSNATTMAQFIDSIPCPALGACLDTGNAQVHGEPERWIRALDFRLFKVHVTDVRCAPGEDPRYVDIGEGDVAWPRVAGALHTVGYQGPLIVEQFASPERPYQDHLATSLLALQHLRAAVLE
jgi:sugar phosphate isomerase/epimerase